MNAGSRVLVLSGSLGSGHDAIARALAAELRSRGITCRIMDSLELLGSSGPRLSAWAFRRLMGSGLYDSFHFKILESEGRFVTAMEGLSSRSSYEALGREIDEFEPDVVLSVFASGVGAACEYKRRHPEGPAVVACIPDAVAHRLWVADEVDVFLVDGTLGAASVRRYRPHATVKIVEFPVPPEFTSSRPGADARRRLHIPAGGTCILLMAGGWGLAPLSEMAAMLASDGLWVLAVTGSNRRLARQVERQASHLPTLVPIGQAADVPALMAAADVVVTTPGATCREARAMGKPLVLVDAVPGHGRENLRHELEKGCASWGGATPSLPRVVRAVLEAPGPCGAAKERRQSGAVDTLLDVGLLKAQPLIHEVGHR